MTTSSLRGQQVVVTSANSRTGVALIPALKREGAFVTALVRQPQAVAEADVVVGDWLNAAQARQAMQRADLIVHLSGEISARSYKAYHAANVAPTERVVEALNTGQARRAVSLSYVGSDPASTNDYLRTNGLREKLLSESRKEAVVFRCPALVNTPANPGPLEEALISVAGKPVQMVGNGQQLHRPIYRGDVVEAIIAALQQGRPGVYDLTGPDEMTADALIQLLNGAADVKISHTPDWLARLLSRFMPDLPPTYVDIMLRNSNPDPARAVKEFGLEMTPLRTLWMPTVQRVAS